MYVHFRNEERVDLVRGGEDAKVAKDQGQSCKEDDKQKTSISRYEFESRSR